MWLDNEIEKLAIRAYHSDPWTEEDYDIMEIPLPSDAANDRTEGIEMANLNRSSEMYEGGYDDQQQKEDEGGSMSTICCCMKKRQNHEGERKNENNFQNMSKEERKAHID